MTKLLFPLAAISLICQLHFFWVSPRAAAQDGTELARAIQLREDNREEEALRLVEQLLEQEPENYQALLNAAYLHFRRGWLHSQKESEQQKLHYHKLAVYAERALALRPTEYQAKLLFLVAKSKAARFLPPGDQVKIARELDRELPALIAMAKDDPTPLYILSWLNMKVGLVGSFEKMLAAVLFGGLPEGLTTDQALTLMQKAIEMRPDYAVYHYDLGLFRQQLGQIDQARKLFEKVLAMAPQTPEEVVYQNWAEQRLTELANYKDSGKGNGE